MKRTRVLGRTLLARLRSERGASLIFALFGLTVMTLLGVGLTGVGMMATTMTTNERDTQNALALADAGMAHAKKMVLFQEWPASTLTFFLASGNAVGCDGDELAQAPAGAPAGYPTQFIPAAAGGGQAVGAGSYRVYVCDDVPTDRDPETNLLDVGPNAGNVDVNKRILIRSVGTTASGASATVEQVIMASTVPALLVNGNLSVRGDVNVAGANGIIHSNGEMFIQGNSACAQQYFSSTNSISGGIPEGGAGCNQPGELRPGSAPINVRVMSPTDYKSRAQYWLSWECTSFNGAGMCQDIGGKVYVNTSYTPAGLNVPNWLPVASGCSNNPNCAVGVNPTGWGFSRNAFEWGVNGIATVPQTVYYFDTNVVIAGNGSGNVTLLAEGGINITGGPDLTPVLGAAPNPIPFIGRITLLSGRDVNMGGNGSGGGSYAGLMYARHQLDIGGSPAINGQVVALNEADTAWPTVAPINQVNPQNYVTLNGGFMIIHGTPNITYSGGGLTGTVARFWRQCRLDPNVAGAFPDDPCGVLWGGP